MSNPGVIELGNVIMKNTEFRIEDNIGEAIHLHYGNIRIDLTVLEFYEMAYNMELAINKLVEIPNFDISEFDETFLCEIAECLKDLEKVCLDNINIKDLYVIQNRKHFVKAPPVIKAIKQSRVVKALNGDFKENNSSIQKNYWEQTNMERVNELNESIIKNGYPKDDRYIVLFNNQNYIRDGQHRVSCLFNEFGDITIPVIRLYFEDNKYNIEKSWIKYLFRLDKERIINVLRGIAKIFDRN